MKKICLPLLQINRAVKCMYNIFPYDEENKENAVSQLHNECSGIMNSSKANLVQR